MAKKKKANRRADDSGVEMFPNADAPSLVPLPPTAQGGKSITAPVSMTTQNVNEWSSGDVAKWLRNIGFPEYVAKFCDVSTSSSF